MKLLTGKIAMSSVTLLSTGRWEINAKFMESTGLFYSYDINIGDNIFCTGLNQDNGDSCVCKYKIEEKLSSSSAVEINCIVSMAEPISNGYFDPQTDGDAIVGTGLQNNLTAISGQQNNISADFIENARNVDLASASFSAGGNKREPIKITDEFVQNRKHVTSTIPKRDSDIVIHNGMILTKDVDYIITDSIILFNKDIVFEKDSDLLSILYFI